jgi:hypothetical protein
MLYKAASEVCYRVFFNNGSTTGPNGVSESQPLTNTHSPAEIARKKSGVGVGCAPVSPALAAGLPLAVAER